MMIDYQGISTLILTLSATFAASYAAYRTIRADRKMDHQQAALELVAANQTQTHVQLANVVGVVEGVQVNVAKVELATNSMKDSLIKTTALANLLQGRNEGIAAEKDRAGADVGSPKPDGAPTVAEVSAAHDAQIKAVAVDSAMRMNEKQTIKDKP